MNLAVHNSIESALRGYMNEVGRAARDAPARSGMALPLRSEHARKRKKGAPGGAPFVIRGPGPAGFAPVSPPETTEKS